MKKQILIASLITFASELSVMPQSVTHSPMVAMCGSLYSDDSGEQLISQIPSLAKLGVNTILIEIGYSYQWKSHPELAEDYFVSQKEAGRIADVCEENRIMIVPIINCVGHQSWEKNTDKLLEVYPQFDETPCMYPKNKGIYCRSWCTQNEEVYQVVFDLIDEITAAFRTNCIHVGMDEIFLIGEDACPRCRGKDKGELLADAINKLHEHCVVEKNLTMFMWGDRLLNGTLPSLAEFGEWETSCNGTYTAVDKIPTDIIICDWHYDVHDEYQSVPYFIDRGFRVLPASYKDVTAAKKLIQYSLKYENSGKMIGHMFTTWDSIPNKKLSTWTPLRKTINLITNE
jgi:hypothetical protein